MECFVVVCHSHCRIGTPNAIILEWSSRIYIENDSAQVVFGISAYHLGMLAISDWRSQLHFSAFERLATTPQGQTKAITVP